MTTSLTMAAGAEELAGAADIVDADAHVIECEETWDHLEGDERRFRPVAAEIPGPDGAARKVWVVDQRVFDRAVGDHTIPDAIRELRDLDGRLQQMDALGIRTQVLYPTLFIGSPTDRPELESALCRSYNRWLADISARSKGRLRWVVVPPLQRMEEALLELEFGARHGACGVFLRGFEGNRTLADSSFFPLYEKASALDLPICIHVGCGARGVREIFFTDEGAARRADIFLLANIPLLSCFHGLLVMGIPARFPELRWGFIEAGAQWVPYMIGEALRRQERMGTVGRIDEVRAALARNRFYVALRTDNDIAQLIRDLGPDNLVMGTDFGHEDASSEIDAFQTLSRRGVLRPDEMRKVMTTNAEALYGL